MERRKYKIVRRRRQTPAGRRYIQFVCRYWDDAKQGWKEKALDVTYRRDADDAAQTHLAELAIEQAVEGTSSDGGDGESAPKVSLDPSSWAGFRKKYQAEHVTTLASPGVWGSAAKLIEQHLQPDLLSDVTTSELSNYASKLRKGGLSEATIETYLKHIRAALKWAKKNGIIAEAPHVILPRIDDDDRPGGRPVTGEEFDRWLERLEIEVGAERFPEWKRLMRGLDLSGLRLGESLNLWWDELDRITISNLEGKWPMLEIPLPRLQKGRRKTTCPITPDFAAFLRETPKRDRSGPVFSPLGKKRSVRTVDYVSRVISAAGAAAKIVVEKDGGEITYATAQDLRRTFGHRWAQRIMPPDLKVLMRHKHIDTTMKYYVRRAAEQTADVVLAAFKKHLGDISQAKSPRARKTHKP